MAFSGREAGISLEQAAKLVKIAGMLGSPHTGEAANAAALCTKIIKEAGSTWEAVIRAAMIGLTQENAKAAPKFDESEFSYRSPPEDGDDEDEDEEPDWLTAGEWQKFVSKCVARIDLFTPWEQEFLTGLRRWPKLSEKQTLVLIRIRNKFLAAGGKP